MQANSLCLRRKTSSILIKETTAEHCLDLSCRKWIHAVIPVLTHIPFQPTAQPAFHHCLLLVPSLTLPWPSALMSCSAQSHRRDAHDVLLKDSDLKQVTFIPLSYKKKHNKAHEMYCDIPIPFMESLFCQNGTERPECKWEQVLDVHKWTWNLFSYHWWQLHSTTLLENSPSLNSS